jgi:hypothetical protein
MCKLHAHADERSELEADSAGTPSVARHPFGTPMSIVEQAE